MGLVIGFDQLEHDRLLGQGCLGLGAGGHSFLGPAPGGVVELGEALVRLLEVLLFVTH